MQKRRLIEFKSKSKGIKKDSEDGEILDHGTIGELKYEIYKRGTIHIFNSSFLFKKDCRMFEDRIDEINFDKMTEYETYTIQGSGDNDDLQFYKEEGEIKIKLIKKAIPIVEKLRDILKLGKKN